jgi:hypothetical protein
MDDKMMMKAAKRLLKKVETMSDKDICGVTLTIMLKGGDAPYPKMKEEKKEEVEEKEEVEDEEEMED